MTSTTVLRISEQAPPAMHPTRRRPKCKKRGVKGRREMIEHKCSFKAFVRTTSGLKFSQNVKRKVEATPFGHYLNFGGRLVVDSSLIDYSCGRWEMGNVFSFGPTPSKGIEMSVKR